MKAKCFGCHWKGEVESPEIKSCPLCGGKLLHYIIDTSQKEVTEDEKKAKTKSQKVG